MRYRGQGGRVEDRYSGPINRRQRIYTSRKYTGIYIFMYIYYIVYVIFVVTLYTLYYSSILTV